MKFSFLLAALLALTLTACAEEGAETTISDMPAVEAPVVDEASAVEEAPAVEEVETVEEVEADE